MTAIVEPKVMWVPVDPPREGMLIPSKMYWRDDRPLEVRVIFGDISDTPDDGDGEDPGLVRWVFSRELITDADTHGKAGLGDVHVEITCARLLLSLTSPFGTIKIRTDASKILNFIKRTYLTVSMSTESDYLPLTDSEIHEQMLDWGLM
jgi:hypothetical protein